MGERVVKQVPDPAILEDFKDEPLINELLRRCDHGVIALYRVLDNSTVFTVRRWKGNSHLASGLSLDMAASIIQEVHATRRPDIPTPSHPDWTHPAMPAPPSPPTPPPTSRREP